MMQYQHQRPVNPITGSATGLLLVGFSAWAAIVLAGCFFEAPHALHELLHFLGW